MGVGACHIRPAESRSSRAPSPLAAPPVPPPFPASSGRGASSRASHRARRRRQGLPDDRRESATSPQDGGRHHRDSPRRAPSPTRKTRRMGPDPGDLSRRGVRRRSAQASTGTPPGNWRRGDGRGWNAGGALRTCAGAHPPVAAFRAAWSGPPAFGRSAYVQAPPGGPSCAIRSRGTATWRPG